MFTLVFMYLIIYTITYTLLLSYFCTFFNLKNVSNYSLINLLNILKKYTNANPIYFLLFILSGLPPVSLFFVKVNFLYYVYSNLSIFNIILIFLNLLLSMLFYLQIFNTSNIVKYTNKSKLNVFNKVEKSILNEQKNGYKKYSFYYFITLLFFINFFFIFFFCDIYLIISQFVNKCQETVNYLNDQN